MYRINANIFIFISLQFKCCSLICLCFFLCCDYRRIKHTHCIFCYSRTIRCICAILSSGCLLPCARAFLFRFADVCDCTKALTYPKNFEPINQSYANFCCFNPATLTALGLQWLFRSYPMFGPTVISWPTNLKRKEATLVASLICIHRLPNTCITSMLEYSCIPASFPRSSFILAPSHTFTCIWQKFPWHFAIDRIPCSRMEKIVAKANGLYVLHNSEISRRQNRCKSIRYALQDKNATPPPPSPPEKNEWLAFSCKMVGLRKYTCEMQF